MDKQKDFEKGWEDYKAKKTQDIKELHELLCKVGFDGEFSKVELKRECEEHLAFTELAKKADEQQKAEIERMTSLYDGPSGFMTSSIGDLPLTVAGLRKAVDEISRLLIVQIELQELNAKYYNEAKDLRRENAELQKQVDELKESANGHLLTILYKKQADDHKRAISVQRTHYEKKVQQAVKDTAKEILHYLIDRAYVNECIDMTVNEVKAWFRDDYGVEVE